MKKIQIVFLILLLLISCSGKLSKDKNITEKIAGNILPKVLPIIHILNSDKSLILNFTFAVPCNNKEKIDYLKSFKKINIDLMDSNRHSIKSIDINNFKIAGIENNFSNAKYILFFKQNVSLAKDEMNKLNTLAYKIIFPKSKITIYEPLDKHLIKDDADVLDLYPIIKRNDNKSIDFGIFTVRNKLVDEYIPNSETLRIEIINNRGKAIWNSGYGGNFMQVIYPVYPENIGDNYTYSSTWRFNKNNGNKVVPGKYTVNLIIPALPKPYFSTITFNLKDLNNDK